MVPHIAWHVWTKQNVNNCILNNYNVRCTKSAVIDINAHMGSSDLRGILLMADIDVLRPTVIVKLAFIFGSSKQGKARRASGASICDTAKYLVHENDCALSVIISRVDWVT